MAAVNPAVWLRARARDALLGAGGRGFVRFAPEGPLLVSDAARRCPDARAAGALLAALGEAGFDARLNEDGMLAIDPADALIESRTAGSAIREIDWSGPLHPAQALAARWLAAPDAPMTERGQALTRETLRLCWQPPGRVLAGLGALRARAAAMLRQRDMGGMRQAGALLALYCISQRGEDI